MALFRRYNWPGNFRQLHNLLRTAVAMVGCEGSIQVYHLPDDFLDEVNDAPLSLPHPEAAPSAGTEMPSVGHSTGEHSGGAPASVAMPYAPTADAHKLEDVTLLAMAEALRRFRGNVSAAAKVLGVSRNTIYRKNRFQFAPGALHVEAVALGVADPVLDTRAVR
jgi:sigma-54 dependent transcriptional regulator, acetoin dehydrogenase operon transcriptional activator AcoR